MMIIFSPNRKAHKTFFFLSAKEKKRELTQVRGALGNLGVWQEREWNYYYKFTREAPSTENFVRLPSDMAVSELCPCRPPAALIWRSFSAEIEFQSSSQSVPHILTFCLVRHTCSMVPVRGHCFGSEGRLFKCQFLSTYIHKGCPI